MCHLSKCCDFRSLSATAVRFCNVCGSLTTILLIFAVIGCQRSEPEDTRIEDPADFATSQDSAANLDRLYREANSDAQNAALPKMQAPIPAMRPRENPAEYVNAGGHAAAGHGHTGHGHTGHGHSGVDPAQLNPPAMQHPVQQNPPVKPPFTLATGDDSAGANTGAADKPGRQLRPDLAPADLMRFLAGADSDLQLILSGKSGITSQREAEAELNRIIKQKLEASKRLRSHADADAKAKAEGERGVLQALSHLASYGDLEAAAELEASANENLKSDDPRLVADSRIVLVGLAIDALQFGKKETPDRVVQLVNQIESNDSQPDVPAMMAMGHARGLLARYGYGKQANEVRKRILELYGNSSDPDVARMAAQVAGSAQTDAIEKLRASAIEDDAAVSAQQWRDAAEQLVDESPDLLTVQYLAGAAIELEGAAKFELAKVTYDILAKRFNDDSVATGRETKAALKASAARASVIGTELPTNLPAIDGSPLLISSYRGKVVLMPFWATNFPASLQVVPMLKEMQKANPDVIAIVGMNLDSSGAQLEQFMKKVDLGFRSYHAASSATDEVANPVVDKFGMVSMPFTVILDQEGRVAGLDFTGRTLQSTVKRLIEQ